MGVEKTDNQNTENVADNKGRAVQLIVFQHGEEEYAIEIQQIKEIVITPNITKMPQTADYVKGVANIRGNIIAIINLEEKFGLKQPEPLSEEKTYTLVLESNEFKAGILVRQMPNTLTVYESDIEDTLNIIHSSSVERSHIKGIVKRENRLIILIDTIEVISEQELQTTQKTA